MYNSKNKRYNNNKDSRVQVEACFIQETQIELIGLGQNAVLLGQTGNAVVGLAHSSDLAADSVDLGRLQHTAGLGVHVDDVQLHRGMILGVDDAVAGGAGRGDNERDTGLAFCEVMLVKANHANWHSELWPGSG